MLQVDNLSKTYPNRAIGMDAVSLRVPAGVFGLLGPNGAGKSTLMRTLATLQDPDAGTARLDDIDLIRDKRAARGVLGYLPQDFGFYPQLTAAEMLDHLAVLKGIGPTHHRKQRVERMLEITNLQDHRKKKLGTFSGGMKQRFGIAQAIIGSPQLLILDEPTAGLDPTERNRFHNLLVQVSEDIVVILSTHIVEDVGDLCPNMAIMNHGRVLVTGTPGDLKAQLAGRIWSKRLSQEEARLATQHLDVISTRLVTGVSEVHALSDTQPGEGFEVTPPDLEDVYFAQLFESTPRAAAGEVAA